MEHNFERSLSLGIIIQQLKHLLHFDTQCTLTSSSIAR